MATGDYEIHFLFNNSLNSVDGVASSCGTVSNTVISGNRLVVNLTGVNCSAQDVTVTLTNVMDTPSNILPSASVSIGLLLGDVDADGVVTRTDFSQVKMDQGQTTDATNFREDVNANGLIDKRDANLVRRGIGTSLPSSWFQNPKPSP